MNKVVYVVSESYLDSGPDGGPEPVAVFSTEQAALAYAQREGNKHVGSKHWWGIVTDWEASHEVRAFVLDQEPNREGSAPG